MLDGSFAILVLMVALMAIQLVLPAAPCSRQSGDHHRAGVVPAAKGR
ncbi:MAG: hypothetical protein HFF14_00635 [Angelakisella sp.]|nr:hypothetical protein [Angelakisella sp.]